MRAVLSALLLTASTATALPAGARLVLVTHDDQTREGRLAQALRIYATDLGYALELSERPPDAANTTDVVLVLTPMPDALSLEVRRADPPDRHVLVAHDDDDAYTALALKLRALLDAPRLAAKLAEPPPPPVPEPPAPEPAVVDALPPAPPPPPPAPPPEDPHAPESSSIKNKLPPALPTVDWTWSAGLRAGASFGVDSPGRAALGSIVLGRRLASAFSAALEFGAVPAPLPGGPHAAIVDDAKLGLTALWHGRLGFLHFSVGTGPRVHFVAASGRGVDGSDGHVERTTFGLGAEAGAGVTLFGPLDVEAVLAADAVATKHVFTVDREAPASLGFLRTSLAVGLAWRFR